MTQVLTRQDRNRLEALLTRAVNALSDLSGKDLSSALANQLRTWTRVLGIPKDQLNKAEQELEIFLSSDLVQRIPTLDEFNGSMVPFGNRGTSRRSCAGLTRSLVNRAFEVGVDTVLLDFETYLRRDYFVARQILPIAGVSIETSVKLEGNLILEPVTGREESYEERLPDYESRKGGTSDYYTNYCAQFVKEHEHPRFFGSRQVTYDDDNRIVGVPDIWDFTLLEDACLCLTLVRPSGPIAVATSLWTSHWVPGLGGPLGRLPSKVESQPPVELSKQDLDAFVRLYRQFVSLSSTERSRLKVPLTRLNSSIRRHNQVDSAIDLGIALESLFSDNRPFDSPISFTLRLRAARLLEDTKESRIEAARRVRDIYSLRSRGAHDGEIPYKFCVSSMSCRPMRNKR